MRKLIGALIILSVILLGCYLIFTGIIEDELERNRHPIAFSEEIKASSEKYGIPQEILYAVILSESSFEPDAKSPVGAKGLMQIMDDTNLWICEMTGMDKDADIYDPKVNIERGSWLLARLYKQFGSWDTAFAAYNAGSGNVTKWLAQSKYSSDGKTLDEIPFEETREYVKRVNKYKEKYKKLYFETEEK